MKRLLFILIFVSSFSFGQSLFIGANYKISVPILDFKNYVSPTSFVGADLDFRYFKNNWFSFGLKLGWSGFFEYKEKETYYWENKALTAEQWNYLYVSDFSFQAHFYAPTKILIKPYFGIHLGSSFVQDYKKVGDLTFNRNFWGFSYMPEMGFLFHLPKPDGLAFYASCGFHQVIINNNHYDNISNIIIKFGIAYSGQYKESTQIRSKKLQEERIKEKEAEKRQIEAANKRHKEWKSRNKTLKEKKKEAKKKIKEDKKKTKKKKKESK